MVFKTKIYQRFLVAYLLLAILPLVIAASVTLWYGRVQIRAQTYSQLQMMADYAEAQVLDYLNYLKIKMSGYSTSRLTVDSIKKHHRHTGNNDRSWILEGYLASVVFKE